jgi:7-cyano-7-deazaguanine synthase
MSKTVVLLSSGLDSTVNLYQSLKVDTVQLALTFDYGQRASKQEIRYAKEICEINGIAHKTVDLRWFRDFTNTSLVSRFSEVPKNIEIDNLNECHQTAKSVWVPNRNGIMIHIAAGFAEGLGADEIIVGFNKEEAATFPDNTQEFLDTLNASFQYSTLSQIRVKCYTTHMNKTEIVRLGKELNVPFSKVWSCYLDGDKPCGTCESCLRLKRALKENSISL